MHAKEAGVMPVGPKHEALVLIPFLSAPVLNLAAAVGGGEGRVFLLCRRAGQGIKL